MRGKTKFDVWMDETYSKEEQAAMTDAEVAKLYEDFEFSVLQGYALRTDAATGLDRPLLPSVRRALVSGNISYALQGIAASADSSGSARIARAFSKRMGNTKVELVSGLVNESGDPVAGFFDPKENTIYLDAVDGMNVHTVLHESTHALVSDTISKPGHPLTKQLQSLLDNVRPAVGAVYGTTNLQEFAAEIMGNTEFQQRLAQLSERGAKITALDRAFHAIRNFVRRLVGMDSAPMETALTRGDRIIMGMLAPAPQFRDAPVLYMAQKKGLAGRIITNALNSAPTATPERVERLENFLTDTTKDQFYGGRTLVREALLRLTPLHYLVQVAGKYFPMAGELNALVNAASAEMSKVRDASLALNSAVGKWAGKVTPEVLDRFNLLVNNSTLYQVDPEITAAEAVKKYGLDSDRMQQWRMVMADWDAVGPEGQAEYRRLRNVFRTQREDLMKALDARLAASIPDADVRDRIRKDLYSQLTKAGTIEPYFPLGRKGDFWMSYNAYDPRSGRVEFFVEAFESRAERDRAKQELIDDPATQVANIRDLPKRESVDFSQAPSASFMARLNDKLRVGGVDEKVIKTISNLYLDTVPETSFLQSYRQRKGTLGFNKDAIKVSTERANNLARSIVQLKYGAQFSAFKSKLDQHARKLVEDQTYSPEIAQLKDQLDAFADFASSPTRSGWSRMGTALTFNMTLGFNISTALLNLMQIPMIGLPTLGGRYGWAQSTRALGDATRAMAGSGSMREIEVYNPDGTGMVKQRVKAAPSLENYDFSDPNLPERIRRLKYLVDVGRANGQFNRSVVYDILDIDGKVDVMQKVSAASGWMLHHAERYNREVSLAAAYNLELDRISAKENRAPTEAEMISAAKNAVYLTEMINGGTAAAATPRIAQSSLGQIAFMYKRYGVSMYALLFDSAKRALVDQSPEARKIAMKQIAGIAGMTGLLSGVAGLPMFGTLAMLWNLLVADDEDQEFGAMVRDNVGDGIYRGALNELLGINIASRIGLSDLLFRESMIEKEQSSLWTLAEQLLGPALGTYMNVERGVKLMSEGDTFEGIKAASPAAIRYLLQAYKFGTVGAITRGGDIIVEDLHPGSIVGQALGFAPASYSAQQEINAARKKFERAVTERKNKLTDRYAKAIRENNTDLLNDTIEAMQEFNEDHPNWPITRESLKRSMEGRARTDKRTYNGVAYNPKLVEEALAFSRDYGA